MEISEVLASLESAAYAAPDSSGRLVNMLSELPVSAKCQFVHSQFRHMVLSPEFSCVGAKAAVNSGAYRFCVLEEMGSREATDALAANLALFIQDQESMNPISTFIAAFDKPIPPDEKQFERLMWDQLQKLHDVDLLEWDPKVSSKPEDPHFSFSFFKQAFFVVGMHPAASRYTRRFAYPLLVFNAHFMFEDLRQGGKFEKFQKVIRNKEVAIQDTINPNLSNFGEKSDAFQYSGRSMDEDWTPPFEVRNVAKVKVGRSHFEKAEQKKKQDPPAG